MRTKHNQDGKQGRTGAGRWLAAAAIVLALGLGVEGARAESPWATLSRWVSPTAQKPAAATAQPGRMAALSDETLGVSRGFKGDLPAVDYENVTAGSMPPAGDFRPDFSRLGLGQGSDPVRLGLESDEDASSLAANLFSNPEMLKLLGEKPRFVYDPAQRPDPMLVPWVRSAAIFGELSEQAEALMKDGQVDAAVEVYVRILALQDPRFTSMVEARLEEIAAERNAAAAQVQTAMAAQQPVPEVVELPAWVMENTTGVLIEPGRALCLVGENVLKEGEALPDFPDVTVAEIKTSAVTYRYRDQNFEVALQQQP